MLTRHTQVARVNGERMRANAIEAAEQCGVLEYRRSRRTGDVGAHLAARKRERLLVFCDEAAEDANPKEALQGGAAAKRGRSLGWSRRRIC